MNNNELREKVLRLATMTAKEMKAYLKENQVKGYSKMKKQQLLELCYEIMIHRSEDINDNTKVIYSVEDDIITKAKSGYSINGLIQAFGGKVRSKQECIEVGAKEVINKLQHNEKVIEEVEKEKEKIDRFNSNMEKLNSNIRARQDVLLNGKSITAKTYLYGGDTFKEMYYSLDSLIIPALGLGRDEYTDEFYDDIFTDKNCIYLVDWDVDIDLEDNIECKINMYNDDIIDFNKSIESIKYKLLNNNSTRVDMFCNDMIDVANSDKLITYSIDISNLLDHINYAHTGLSESEVYIVDTDYLLNSKKEIQKAINEVSAIKDEMLKQID